MLKATKPQKGGKQAEIYIGGHTNVLISVCAFHFFFPFFIITGNMRIPRSEE